MTDASNEPSPAPESTNSREWWRSAPGPIWHFVATVSAGWLLVDSSDPGLTTTSLILSPVVPALGLVWVLRGLGWILDRERQGHRRWLIAPAGALLTVSLLFADLPLRARFELARSDFDAEVAALPDTGCGKDRRQTGSYNMLGFTSTDGGTFFLTFRGSFISKDHGFAYLPDTPAAIEARSSTRLRTDSTKLGDGWYAWSGLLPRAAVQHRPTC